MMSQHDPPTSEYGGRDGVCVSFIDQYLYVLSHGVIKRPPPPPSQHAGMAMG